VLEAGRFAPARATASRQFIVVTDKAVIDEMNNAVYNVTRI
jgi:hypothetical protein